VSVDRSSSRHQTIRWRRRRRFLRAEPPWLQTFDTAQFRSARPSVAFGCSTICEPFEYVFASLDESAAFVALSLVLRNRLEISARTRQCLARTDGSRRVWRRTMAQVLIHACCSTVANMAAGTCERGPRGTRPR
jgi:hypothetical protein